MPRATPKVVEVTWEDHVFRFGDTRNNKTALVYTVGYLVEDHEDYITVAFSDSDGDLSETQLIDKRMLVKVTTLRKAT